MGDEASPLKVILGLREGCHTFLIPSPQKHFSSFNLMPQIPSVSQKAFYSMIGTEAIACPKR